MVKKVTRTSKRKSEHIQINLERDVQSGLTTGLELYHFEHQALPEINLDDIDLSVDFLGKQLKSPLMISSMTGGTQESLEINENLARAAQITGIAMGVGSQRAGIEDTNLAISFQIRKFAPNTLLFANLGAIQLNYGFGIDDCQKAVDMLEADALILHLNPLQEALQDNGNTKFSGLLGKIEKVCKKLPVPIIVKEVGWGISKGVAKQLASAGVAAIDVAGAGGTSWSEVEKHRIKDESRVRLASVFSDWGISTSESILNVREIAPNVKIIASGGIRNGVDIAKSIALGATLAGIAGPFLKTAVQSQEQTISMIEEINAVLRISMFAVGAKDIQTLAKTQLIKT